MGNQKRNASTFAAMEASSGATLSKKRKTTSLGTCQLQLRASGVQLRTSHLQDTTVSPATSVNSADFFLGQLPLTSCCSISSAIVETKDVVKDGTAALNLEANVFETVDSTFSNFKLFSKDKYLLSEFSGDSEETSTTVFQANSSAAAKVAPKEEIEEFFAMAEKYEQKRFAEKYNYDIVKDIPLRGRYQWVPSI